MRLARGFSACALLIGLAAPAILAAPANDPDKVDPKWKFEKDRTFFQEAIVDMEQNMTVMGNPVAVKSRQTVLTSWTPVTQLEDKSWVIKEKIVGMKMDMDVLGQKISYDSTNPQGGNKEMADGMAPFIGAEFEQTVSPQMKVTKVTGYKELLDKMGQNNPKAKQMMGGVMSEETIKQMGDALFAVVPNKSVAKGDTWFTEDKTTMPSLGALNIKRNFTYVGKKGSLEEIKFDAKLLKHEPPAGNAGGALPFTLKKLDLNKFTTEGTVLFDGAKGRVDSSNATVTMNGKMTIEIQNMETTIDLQQTQKMAVKTSDTNPWKK